MMQLYKEIFLSIFGNYRGTIEHTRYDTYQDSMILCYTEPSRLFKFFMTREFVVINRLEFNTLRDVVKASNNGDLSYEKWKEIRGTFPFALKDFLNKYLYLTSDKSSSQGKYDYLSPSFYMPPSKSDGGFQYTPPMDFPPLDFGSSLDDNSSSSRFDSGSSSDDSSSNNFDFGGGDTGGGGAGGDY